MPIAVRHRAPTPLMTPLPGLAFRRETDPIVMARLQSRDTLEIIDRFVAGHRAYVATIEGIPAAWGWVATSSARIGEVATTFMLDSADRYLWNFVTLPAFRGRGIYPRLLNAIVAAESADESGPTNVERFWIAYAPENHASGAGIRKAGFELVADLSFDAEGRPVVRDIRPDGGAAAARLVGLPVITEAVAQCWKCARGPAPASASCSTGRCSCDYQQKEVACAEPASGVAA